MFTKKGINIQDNFTFCKKH